QGDPAVLRALAELPRDTGRDEARPPGVRLLQLPAPLLRGEIPGAERARSGDPGQGAAGRTPRNPGVRPRSGPRRLRGAHGYVPGRGRTRAGGIHTDLRPGIAVRDRPRALAVARGGRDDHGRRATDPPR